MINWSLFFESLSPLALALLVNVQIMVVGSLLGLIGGLPLALAEQSRSRLVSALATTYCILFRGTPMLVQIMCVFYLFPQVGVHLPPLLAVMLTVGLNSAAYMAQIIRSALRALPKTQWQAAKALGMSRWQTIRYVIVPQCYRAMLPSLGNEGIVLLKDSSLASVIGVMEIVKVGAVIRGRTFETFTVFLALALIFLLATLTLTLILKWLEKRSLKPCSW